MFYLLQLHKKNFMEYNKYLTVLLRRKCRAQGIQPKKSSFFESTFVRRQVRVCNFNNNAKKVLGSIQTLRLLEYDQNIN